jgi:hypothetical protein
VIVIDLWPGDQLLYSGGHAVLYARSELNALILPSQYMTRGQH